MSAIPNYSALRTARHHYVEYTRPARGALRPQRRANRADQHPRERLPSAHRRPQGQAGRAADLRGCGVQDRRERRIAPTRAFRVRVRVSARAKELEPDA